VSLRAVLSVLSLLSVPAAALDPAAVQRAAAYSARHRGAALLVVQHGRVLFESNADEPRKIFSGTKAFWNLAALAAVQDGWLDLDERVSATLPEWRADPPRARVTVRMLLDFTAGLEPAFFLHGDRPADRNRTALALPLVAEPGRAFIYGPSALQVFHEVLRRKLAPHGLTPTAYLERRVLRPLGLGPQRYLADRAGRPLLATGWILSARDWSKLGRVVLAGGAPIVRRGAMAPCFRGTPANRAFSLGWWNNRAAPGGRAFDIEDMLERDWRRQDWRGAALCREAPRDLVACLGSGYQRLFVVPSLGLVVVRFGEGGRFSDAHFLRLLLGR
jgi:CubicO group peptidase (beta-lactamase class C family)